ncbi:hypothetical protein [Embleya hyalina]|uniref:Uncharacterized protein n=1 Tax=Embleya hyalina TaxID=516124 RepID=A0A401YM05_9ACTN|nr:hypothetical protein [Embleya hyalina]GCD95529.1 hypothetical protein EHYA_03203 [Embleya hyalina]
MSTESVLRLRIAAVVMIGLVILLVVLTTRWLAKRHRGPRRH